MPTKESFERLALFWNKKLMNLVKTKEMIPTAINGSYKIQ